MSAAMTLLRIVSTESLAPLHSELLFAIGADSVSESVHADGILLTAVFRVAPEVSLLEQQFSGLSLSFEVLREESWKKSWMEHLQPVKVHEELVLVPLHWQERYRPDPSFQGQVLYLDSSESFGDGSHATTLMCARLLFDDLTAAGRDERAKLSILDVGTGSGVLALAASQSGVGEVDAFDIDPFAVIQAEQNALVNRLDGVHFFTLDIAEWLPDRQYHLVIANLLTDLLETYLEKITRAVRAGGSLILSGISQRWQNLIERIFLQFPDFLLERKLEEDGWTAYLFKRIS